MEQFQIKFIEEATDLIDELEELLLQNQIGSLTDSFVEQVFRVMHSLKGSGAMFGFQSVSDFAHNLEDMYDKIRSGELLISEKILDITLTSVDIFKRLLDDPESSTTDIEVKLITNQVVNIASNQDTESTEKTVIKEESTKAKTYWIEFKPNPEIFDNGTNPLFVIDELSQMGSSVIIPNFANLPPLSNLEPSQCYVSWSIILATENSQEDLDEVFMFVEDSSKISIIKISDKNVIDETRIIELIDEVKAKPNIVNKSFIQAFISTALEIEKQKTEENIQANLNDFNKRKQLNSIRIASDKIDTYVSLVSELVTVQTSLSILGEKLKNEELSRIVEDIEHLSRSLRDNAISISLVPFSTIFSRFQRLVHDLSREFSKEITLKAEGMDTELDKSMIQTITDPLMHIIRNSIDHGIEAPSHRKAKGKPSTGTITMRAFHSGANIIIEVEDDGQGIDPQKIKESAIRKNIITNAQKLNDDELIRLILKPGFSTAEKTTSVSGRGVGMDVVNQNVNSLKGSLEFESELGKFTKIRIKLPQSLSILDGMLVSISDTLFVIPSAVLIKIAPVLHSEIVHTTNSLIYIDEEYIPFLNLRKEFSIHGEAPEKEELVILEYESIKVALLIDQVHNEYQVVLRPLGKFLKDDELLLGASIIGEGNIALVLDTDRIIKKAINRNLQK